MVWRLADHRARYYVQRAMPARPVRLTTVTKLVLRTLATENRPMYTAEIAADADLAHVSVRQVMDRLEDGGWATSVKESRQQASAEGRGGTRRTWSLTQNGAEGARQVLDRSLARAAQRQVSTDVGL